uniref:Uncharacterized protein n=1 Tax=Rhizophora mucronata TaxID=61149 RepID=A0A2P2JNM3_RHIMU
MFLVFSVSWSFQYPIMLHSLGNLAWLVNFGRYPEWTKE